MTGLKNNKIADCRMHHVTVSTSDINASMKLYQDVLGMTPVTNFTMPDKDVYLLDIGDGSHIELFHIPGVSFGKLDNAVNHPLQHIALATSDTEESIEKVRAAGYEVTMEPVVVDIGKFSAKIAFFTGPSGEEIEFFENV